MDRASIPEVPNPHFSQDFTCGDLGACAAENEIDIW
jgi:hypothetical protein